MDQELRRFMDDSLPLVERELEALLPPADRQPAILHKAMRYAVMSQGKRLRPILSMLGCKAVGKDPAEAVRVGCAFEIVHAYSLVHDDLPAMDDAELRRGRPTVHKAFGEAMAILAGDALLTFAFEVMASAAAPQLCGPLVAELARAAGPAGMVAGQVMDIDLTGKPQDETSLSNLHRLKTGAMIRSAVVAGGIAGGASQDQVAILADYGSLAGLAFQVADDILDVESTAAVTGKDSGADAAAGKVTYPALLGLEGAKAKAAALAACARAAAAKLPAGGLLASLAGYFVERSK